MGVIMVLAVNLRTQKSPVWTLSPKHRGQYTDCREAARWPGWLEKVLPAGISIHHFLLQNHSSQKGKAVPSLPIWCFSS